MSCKKKMNFVPQRNSRQPRVSGLKGWATALAALTVFAAGNRIAYVTPAPVGQQGSRSADVRTKRQAVRNATPSGRAAKGFTQTLTPQAAGPTLATVDFDLIGLAVTVGPASQDVPKNTPTVVNTSIQTPKGTDPNLILAKLNPNYKVFGELSGPSLSSPLTLQAAIGQPLQVPGLSTAGDHAIRNLRVVDTGSAGNPVIASVTPDSVGIVVIEQLLISQVQVTQLSYDQIIQSGINITDDSYNFVNFTLGLTTASGTVPISIPVALPDGSVPNAPPVVGRPNVNAPVGMQVPSFTAAPVMLSFEDANGGSMPPPMFGDAPVQIPGVVVFPGRIGFLHQFFEAIVIVTNGAPSGAPLVVHDLHATIKLPDNGTPNDPSDDPLRIAATQSGGVVTDLEIHGLGPDGQYGTSDDTTTFSPGQSGQASFLLEGLKEGLAPISFDLKGTLDGLPIGPVTVTGSVPGSVLVRDPTFSVTFMHPSVVRAGQEYDLAMTLNNTGNTNIQGAVAHLSGNSISGAELLAGDNGDRAFATDIPPLQSSTVVWRLRSDTTGAVTASYVKVGDGVQAGLILTTGVGDRNVPLSPDSLILPDETRFLPPPIVDAARQVLGQAWGVANAPMGSLPAGVTPITPMEVINRAVDVGVAGVRVEFGEPLEVSLGTLVRDWMGEAEPTPDPGFADALRNTVSGYNWYDTVGSQLAGVITGPPPLTPVQLHQEFANAESPRSQFISAIVSQSNGQPIFGASLADTSGNSVGDGASLTQRSGDIELGASMRLNTSDPNANPATRLGQMLLVSRPQTGTYTLAINGWQNGTIDISLLVPVSGTNYRQVVFSQVPITAGGQYRIVFNPSGTKALTFDTLVNGSYQPTSAAPTVTSIQEPAPHVEGVLQVSPDVLTGGDKYGRLVGILFSKPMEQTVAEIASHYQIGGGALTGSNPPSQVGTAISVAHAKLNFGARMVLLSLDAPIGPFIDRSLTASSLTDIHGVGLANSPFTSPITITVSPQGNPPGGYLTGHVLLADGTPVAGASVVYWTQPCSSDAASPITSRITDSQGRYEIDYVRNGDCGPVVVTATNPTTGSVKRLSTSLTYNGQHMVIDLVFLARGGVQGSVTIQGAPAPNAFVRVTPVQDVNGTVTVQSDAAGHYVVNDIPVGDVSVFAVGAGSQSNATGLAAGNVPGPGQLGTVDVSLQSLAGVVKGSVVHFDQTPVVGALVVASFLFPGHAEPTPVGFSFTDRQGNYSISNLPVGAISIAATDYVTGVRVTTNVQLTTGLPEVDGVVLTLPGNGSVSGTVTDDRGAFVSGAIVTAAGSGVVADALGNYTLINMPAGTTTVSATDPTSGQSGSTRVTVVIGQTISNVDIIITRPASLNGHVYLIDASGNKTPVAKAIVTADGFNQVQTDITGAYSLGNVGSNGSVLLRAVHPNNILAANVSVTLGAGEVLTRDIVFHIASIHGKVVQPDGTPAVAQLSVVTPLPDLQTGPDFGVLGGGQPLSTQSAADGTYQVTVMNPGTYSVTAFNAFFPVRVSKGGTLVAGDNQECDLTLVNTLAGKIQGTVFQPDGVTPVGANVNVTIGGGSLANVTVRTDQNGHFEFAQVFSSGGYRLTATDPISGATNQIGISATANQDLIANIRLLGTGTLTVTVVDGAGNPATTGSINVDGASYPNAHRFWDITASGSNVATFGGLTEGQYAISANQTGLAGRASVTITNGGSASVTVQLQGSGVITGLVVMPDGKTPVGLADVQLISNGAVLGVTETSNDDATLGTYTFQNVPTGNFTLSVLDNRTGRVGRAFGTLSAQGQTVTINVALLAQGTVIGQVTSNGTPVDHATVNISANGSGIAGTSLTATTDPNGDYRFDGIPQGTFTVTASSGGLTGSTNGSLSGTTDPIPPIVANIALQPSVTVSGTVFDADGVSPVSGAGVTLFAPGRVFTGTTTTAGIYTFPNVPLGQLSAQATAPVGFSRGQSQTVTASQAGVTVTINVTLTGVGNVGGDALDSDGTKLTNGTVTFTSSNASGPAITLVAPVQPTGRYLISGVPAGAFSIQLAVPNRVEAGSATGSIINGQTLELPLRLADAGTITGTVDGPDGKTPASGADVTLILVETTGQRLTMVAHTNTQGVFTFANVPLGTGSISVNDPNSGGLAVASGIQLTSNGQTADVGKLVLDTAPITVLSVSPANGATNVATSTVVTVNFSEAASANTVNSGTVRLLQGASSIPSTVTLSPDGTIATLKPSNPLADTTSYTIDVSPGVQDLVGHPLPAEFQSTFTTVDQTPPSVTAIAPLSNATQVALSASITVTFSEPLDPSQSFGSVIGLAAGSAPGTPVTGSATLDASGKVVTFTPSSALIDSTQYTVTVTGEKDLAGNIQTSSFISRFTTVDITPPIVDPLPINGTSPTTLTPTITATYHDNLSGVNPASVILTLDGINVTSQASVGGTGLSFTPSSPLARGSHTVTVQVSDFARNQSDQRPASFTLSNTAPVISSFTIGGQPAVDGMVVASSLEPPFAASYSSSNPIDTTRTQLLLGLQGTTPAPVAAVVTSTGLTFTATGAMTEGSYVTQLIVFDTLGNSSTSGVINFTLNVTRPLIETVTPSTGSQHGGTAVTLTGQRLTSTSGAAPSVTVGGNPATVTGATQGTAGASDQVTFVTPAGAPGPATIEVVNDHGLGSLAAGFTYQADSKTPFSVEPDTLLLWHLDEASNGAVSTVDSGPLHLTGTASGNSSAAAGRFAGGRSRAAIVADSDFGSLDFGRKSFTLECWENTAPVGRTYDLVARDDVNGNTNDFGLLLFPSGQIQAYVIDTNGTNVAATVNAGVYPIDDSQWHSLAMVVDRAAGQVLLYIDGQVRASNALPGTFAAVRNQGQPFKAGHYVSSAPSTTGGPVEFTGVLDEVRVSASAHSASLIQQEYQGTQGSLGMVALGTTPQSVFVGATSEVDVSGYNLAGASATVTDSAGAPVTSQVIGTSATLVRLQVTLGTQAAIGAATVNLTSAAGSATTTFNISDLNRIALNPEPDTLLLWHLDESGNGAVTTADSGPLSINGTASGNSSAAAGRFAGGRTRAAIVANSDFGAFDFGSASFTVECWINTTTVGRTFTLVGRDDVNGNTNDFALQLFPSGALQGYVIDTGGTLASVTMPPTVYDVDDGQWHYLVMVVDRPANQLLIYADGQLQASANLPAGFAGLRNQGQALKAGHYVSSAVSTFGGPLEFTGTLDEIRVSSTAHSALRIQQDYNGTSGLRVTSFAPFLIARDSTSQQPSVTPITVNGYGLDGITAQLVRNGQTFAASINIANSTYRQAAFNAVVPPSTPLGPAQIVLSKAGQPSATINVEIAEQASLVAERDTLLLWHLDETGSGAVNVVDSGPLSITGLASGNSSAAPGRFGGGRARAAIVAASDLGAFDFKTASFTVDCWINTAPVGRTFTLVGRDDVNGNTNDFALQLFPSGELHGYVIDTSGTVATVIMRATAYNVDDSQWHFLTLVVDRSANQLLLYADGQLQASANLPAGFGALRNQGQTLKAGHYVSSAPSSFGGPLEFTGVLDDVRVSSTAHSPDQVQQDFGGSTLLQVASYTPSLIPRDKSRQQSTLTSVSITGFNLDGVTAQLLRNGQSFNATIAVNSSSYRQANVTVTVPPSTTLGPAQIVLSKTGQADVTITVQIAEQSPFVSSSDTLMLWHLDENVGGGGTVLDSGPLSINGTLSGNATSGPGRFGLGKVRAAITGNPDFGAFDFKSSSFTIECWINTTAVGRAFTLVGRDDANGNTNDFALQLSPIGALQGYAIDTGGTVATVVMPGTTYNVTDGQWHDVSMVVDRGANEMSIYADGQLQATASMPTGFGAIRNQGQTLKAGHYVSSAPSSFGGPLEFTGTLDEIRVSSTAHSAAEIASDYYGQNGLQVAKVTPASIQQGATSVPVTLSGFGLDGASVTSATTGITVSTLSTTVTSIQIQVSVDPTVPIGPLLLTVTDVLGQSTTTSFTVVNQQPFANPASGDTQTPVLWHLDDASGTRVTGSGDLVPTLVGGNASGNSSIVAGRFGNGRTRASIIGDADNGGLDFKGSSFTVECWINTLPVGRTFTLVGRDDTNGNTNDFAIQLFPFGELHGYAVDTNGTVATAVVPGTAYTVDDGLWHNIVMVVDRTANTVALYIDGQQQSSVTLPSGFANLRNQGQTLKAGHYVSSGPSSTGGPLEFPGNLDEIRVLSIARTAAQIHDTWFGTTTAAAQQPKTTGHPVDSLLARLLSKSWSLSEAPTASRGNPPRLPGALSVGASAVIRGYGSADGRGIAGKSAQNSQGAAENPKHDVTTSHWVPRVATVKSGGGK